MFQKLLNFTIMKYILLFMVCALFYLVDCKNNAKSLTESMGQEVIEVGAPIKELPPGVEEEPSPDDEDTERPAAPAAKKPGKTTKIKIKPDAEIEDTGSQEDEEARIEKELEEIYKDTDYKADKSETINKVQGNMTGSGKPIARTQTEFKFQPDGDSPAAIERFRTSVDEINCARRVTQRLSGEVREGEQSKSTSRREYIVGSVQMAVLLLTLLACY